MVICTTYPPPCQWPWLLQLALRIFSPSEYPLPCENLPLPVVPLVSVTLLTAQMSCVATNATEQMMGEWPRSMECSKGLVVYHITPFIGLSYTQKSLRVRYSVLASPLSSQTAYLTTESL